MKGLTYPSTYHAMKAGPCRVGVCKYDGKCGLCEEYGLIRRYAARDTDRIHELSALVKEMEDEKRISDAVVQSMRDKKLEMAGEIAAKDAEVAELRERIKIAEDALKIIDNMCDGDMCKFFDNTHHCSACRYLNECQTGVAHAALAAIREKGEEDDK